MQAALNFDICEAKHGGNPNSVAAHATIAHKKKDLHALILAHLSRHPGLTCQQISAALELPYTTASARISELKAAGRVKESGRAKTSSGCSASMLVIA